MAIDWFRLDCDYSSNPKVLELVDLLDEPLADAYVTRLWAWCTKNARDGQIRSANPGRMIERAVGWRGEPGALAGALAQVGVLDREDDGNLTVHGWLERNGKAIEKAERDAAAAKARRDAAKQPHLSVARPTRDESATNAKPSRDQRASNALDVDATLRDVDATQTTTTKSDLSGAVAPDAAAVPSVPTLADTARQLTDPQSPVNQPLLVAVPPEPERPDPISAQADRVFEHWRTRMGMGPGTKFTADRRKAVEARLRGNQKTKDPAWTVEELCRAVDGCSVTPHNMGENENGTPYNDLELICRTGGNVDRFIRNAASPPKRKAGTTNPAVDAAFQPREDW